MNFTVSNCCFEGDAILNMAELPKEFGIEVQIEFGTEYYWKTSLEALMKDRMGSLSIHGQYMGIDLAAADLNESEIFEYYKWGFDMYNRYHAQHFVIHPDGKISAPATEQQVADMRSRALDRVAKLGELARRENVHLLVENLRPKGYGMVFDMENFIQLFDQIPDVNGLIDTGHLFLSKWDFHHVMSSLKDRIKSYHINDTWGLMDEHLPVGKGAIDWGAFCKNYKKYTPDAEMVLEYKNVTIPDIEASARLVQSLLNV